MPKLIKKSDVGLSPVSNHETDNELLARWRLLKERQAACITAMRRMERGPERTAKARQSGSYEFTILGMEDEIRRRGLAMPVLVHDRNGESTSSSREKVVGGEVRKERLAINVPDMLRIDDLLLQKLEIGKLVKVEAFYIDKNDDEEAAVEFTCPLLQACLICDIIRDHDRKSGDSPCRVYLKKRSAWVDLPGDLILTVKLPDRSATLNPEMFVDAVPVVAGPPLRKAVNLEGVRRVRK